MAELLASRNYRTLNIPQKMNIKYPIEDTHTLSIGEVLQSLQTDVDKGISKSEAEKRLQRAHAEAHNAGYPLKFTMEPE